MYAQKMLKTFPDFSAIKTTAYLGTALQAQIFCKVFKISSQGEKLLLKKSNKITFQRYVEKSQEKGTR